MRKSEDGGVSCGICSINLQHASLGFGIADVTHGILGVAVVVSMLIKKENDVMYKDHVPDDRKTGYTKFLDQKCPLWLLYLLFGAFILQIVLGVILGIGASHRNSVLCILWTIGSLVASPVLPMTYCLVILGRVYQWVTVGEFIWKMDDDELKYRLHKK